MWCNDRNGKSEKTEKRDTSKAHRTGMNNFYQCFNVTQKMENIFVIKFYRIKLI
jgi:hypothetical protein